MSNDLGNYLDTDQVARNISCEFRTELVDLTASFLEGKDPALAKAIREKPEIILSVRSKLGSDLNAAIDRYATTTVTYSYTFTVNEANNAGGSALIGFPYTPLNLKFTAQNDRTRQTIRTLDTSDGWLDLFISKDVARRCLNSRLSSENYLYPIAGKIGVREQIKSFFNMVQQGNLAGDEDSIATTTDSFEFLTRFVGKVEPSVELARVGGSPQFVSGSATVELRREDKHAVDITIAIPKPKSRASQKASALAGFDANRRQQDLRALSDFSRR